MNPKQLAGEKAVEFIEDGMIVGLGTGSTAYWAIQKIGQRVREGLRIRAIATSTRSEQQARSLQIPIIDFADTQQIDITIDGADEADAQLNLIKGGGGALLREKIVATNSRQLIVVADESKLVRVLGKYPLPVETVIFGYETVQKKLKALGCEPKLRMDGNACYLTDNGNYILDCAFNEIKNPLELHEAINAIVGVVENGLFVNIAAKMVIAYQDGSIRLLEK